MSIVKNNLSPLPFFSAIEDRDKWYGYGRKTPLICGTQFLPFIVRMEHHGAPTWETLTPIHGVSFRYLDGDGNIQVQPEPLTSINHIYRLYNFANYSKVRVATDILAIEGARAVKMVDESDTTLYGEGQNEEVTPFEEDISVPDGATLMEISSLGTPAPTIKGLPREEISLTLISENGERTELDAENYLNIIRGDDYDYIIPAGEEFTDDLSGVFYLELTYHGETQYSAWFSPCVKTEDLKSCLEIKWSDNESVVLDDFLIPYSEGYENRLIFDSELCYPEYIYEDEVISRDGYEYPTKNISYKKYKFVVLGQEEICDVMRLIHLSDTVTIYSQGKEYDATSFNMNVEWLEGGFLAKISCEFTTDTVVKKLAKKI